MDARIARRFLLVGAAIAAVHAVAIPDPTAVPAKVEVRTPVVTPAAIRFDGSHSYMYDRRNVISDIANGADSLLDDWGSILKTDVPSFFTDGK